MVSRVARGWRWLIRMYTGLLVAFAMSMAGGQALGQSPTYEVFAVRYATLPQYRVASLVEGAAPDRRLDLAMMVWLLRGSDGRVVLVDAGFKPRPDLMSRWRPVDYISPDSALARFGVPPDSVDDVIVSHVHWDHFDGADLFPRARVWLQREEIEHHVDAAGRVLDRTIDATDAAMLHALRTAGRLQAADGDAREIMPGITVYTGGKHTFQSQYVSVRTVDGTVVIASDNVYLYENLDRNAPIAQTLDRASNLAAQARMREIASDPRLIIPGHDPEVFARFDSVAPGVVKISSRK